MKLGVITDCFLKNVKEAISLAKELSFDAIQIYATKGEFSPATLSDEDIASYRALLAEKNLKISALCGDMGGFGFEIEEDNPARIEKTCRIIDLAKKLDTKVVTTHIGVIPEDKNHPRYGTMLRALRACGDYAKSQGVTLAIETGPETAPVLHDFVHAAGEGVGVNLDPANFVMVTGQDPAEAVRILKDKIVHTHAKDGRRLKETDPLVIYHHFATGGIEALNVADYFIETPIGEGDVDWDAYVGALREIGYDGYLTIERETGKDPVADIVLARDFLRKYL